MAAQLQNRAAAADTGDKIGPAAAELLHFAGHARGGKLPVQIGGGGLLMARRVHRVQLHQPIKKRNDPRFIAQSAPLLSVFGRGIFVPASAV